MTAWQELQAKARAMSVEEQLEAIKGLSTDPRFPAFLALLDRAEEEGSAGMKEPLILSDHGLLANTVGGINSIRQLRDTIRQDYERPTDDQD